MANKQDTQHDENKAERSVGKNIKENMYEDFIGLGITEKQYKRLSSDEPLELKEELHNKKDAANSLDENKEKTSRQLVQFLRNLGNFERIGVVGMIMILFMGVLGSGVGSSLIDSLTGRDNHKPAKKSSSANNVEENQSLLSRLNPFSSSAPVPTNTPQLSKEYIYAGSRMLAVEDANATAVPPADLAYWRPSNGYWYVLGGTGSQQTTQGWGTNGDIPAPGDYDGDGKTDFAVYRPSAATWYVMKSSGGNDYYYFGNSTDKVVPADFDGDGKTDAALWRPSTGTWYIRESSTSNLTSAQFGLSGDIPNPKDFDGDGKADIGVFRPATSPAVPTFYSYNSSDGAFVAFPYGIAGDIPAIADYDGDGKDDYAVRRGATWYVLQSSDGVTKVYTWGLTTDQEVPNDYDGDGRADIAVWRPSNGTWYIMHVSDLSQRIVQWGAQGDIPVPAYYRQ